jgi:hypothetical protein
LWQSLMHYAAKQVAFLQHLSFDAVTQPPNPQKTIGLQRME